MEIWNWNFYKTGYRRYPVQLVKQRSIPENNSREYKSALHHFSPINPFSAAPRVMINNFINQICK